MSMKILALDGLNDSKLCKLVSSLIQTVDGVEYANIDYLSQKLTIQLAGRDSAKIIAKVSVILKENMPGVTIKFKEVGERDEKAEQATLYPESGMSVSLAKAISTMMKEEPGGAQKPQAQAPISKPPEPVAKEEPFDPMVKTIVDEPVIEIIESPVEEEEEPVEDILKDEIENLVESDEGEVQEEPEEKDRFAFLKSLLARFGTETLVHMGGVLFGFIMFLVSLPLQGGSVAGYVVSIICLIVLSVFALIADTGKYKTPSFVAAMVTVLACVLSFFSGHMVMAMIALLFYHITFFGVYCINDHYYLGMSKSLDVKPATLKRYKDGNIEITPFADVWSGDEVVLDKGETVPFDSVIVNGETMVDDSLISGKPDPIEIKEGGFLNCGSKIVGDGIRIAMVGLQENSIAAVARETMLNDSADLNQVTSKAGKWSALLLLVQIALTALISGLVLIGGKYDLLLSVLPAALLLFAPVGVVATVKAIQQGSLGKALRHGIIIVSSVFLEEIAQAKTIVTGCGGILTKKSCKVVEVLPVDDYDIEDLVKAAAYTESRIEHPISKAICDYYTKKYDKQIISSHIAFCESSENGVKAMAEARIISVGSESFMQKSDIEVPYNETGKNLVYVAKYGDHIGTLVMKEERKEGADSISRQIKSVGFEKTVLLSSRDTAAVEPIGKKCGYDAVYSDCRMAEKIARVSELMSVELGRNIVFAGEVNDCEMLSDICPCIAMGEDSFSSMLYAAKVIIPSGDPKKLVKALKICKNSQWLSLANIIGISAIKIITLVLALFGFMPFVVVALINMALMVLEALIPDLNLRA